MAASPSARSGWILDRRRAAERSRAISTRIFVGNLNFQTNKDELANALAEAGEITEISIPTDRMTGRPRGFAFVEFAAAEQAQKAIELLDGKELGGRALRVNLAEERSRRPAGNRFAPSPPPDFGGGRGGFGGGYGGYGGGGGGGKSKGSRRGLRGKKRSL